MWQGFDMPDPSDQGATLRASAQYYCVKLAGLALSLPLALGVAVGALLK